MAGHRCALLAASFLAGCANIAPAAKQTTSVTTFISAESPLFPNQRETGAGDTQVRNAGAIYISIGPLMEVRKCNAEMTSCAWGVAKVASRMTLVGADNNGATVAVELVYDLGREQQLTWDNTMITDRIPGDIPVLVDSANFSKKKVTVPYGQMRRVSFSHGVDFNISAIPADPRTLIAVDNRCELDGIMTGKTAQSAIPAL
ncbi:hypothetical protein CBA19CS22_39010 [Caballeronia novacaledonica]|uniref:Uncharacterized protein n=1 Tax=Caballeronia novacaledonica TaxID=1544861 RepID=A0ACB5R655_9BURK|nr:hypothetical protein [Caballeronia sp. LZ029]MDR5746990.1 hypothetical protein [Caballeronia sp. LZ029]GJH22666.1 hypothetical protein CBA19CS22_39010 [Caballeronia novacaledonica]